MVENTLFDPADPFSEFPVAAAPPAPTVTVYDPAPGTEIGVSVELPPPEVSDA
jgi:hypothetical protein